MFSGTYRVNAEDTTPLKNKWSMARLGLFKYHTEMTEKQAEFNIRILQDVDFKVHKWIFPKENFNYTILTDEELLYPRKKEIKKVSDAKLKWSENLTKFYDFYRIDFFGKYNSLILVGSYDDAEIVAESLRKKVEKSNIFYETQNESIGNLLKRYSKKAMSSRGNVLIGTLTCFTGINLYGDLCHSIIMTKLPYAPFTGLDVSNYKDGANISYRISYENEMVLTFRQGIGRASRSENDEVVLFLLD